MLKKLGIIVVAIGLVGCAGVTRFQIEDDLKEIGVPPKKASCIGKELIVALPSKDLKELSAFLDDLAKAKDKEDGLDLVLNMENPEVVAAVTGTALTCAFS